MYVQRLNPHHPNKTYKSPVSHKGHCGGLNVNVPHSLKCLWLSLSLRPLEGGALLKEVCCWGRPWGALLGVETWLSPTVC